VLAYEWQKWYGEMMDDDGDGPGVLHQGCHTSVATGRILCWIYTIFMVEPMEDMHHIEKKSIESNLNAFGSVSWTSMINLLGDNGSPSGVDSLIVRLSTFFARVTAT